MLKNIVQSLVTKSAVAIINFLILIISSRYLGVSSRGDISLFILNISIVQIISGIFTGYSIVHFVPKFSFKKIVRDGIVFTLLFNSLSNAIIVFLNKQVLGYEWLGYLVSLLVILNTFNCMLLLGNQNIKQFNLLSIMQPLLLLVGLFVYIFGFSLFTFEAYLFPLLISFTLAYLFSSWVIFKNKPKNDLNTYNIKTILSNGFAFQSGLLMYLFCSKFSYYLLADKASVGLYASSAVLAESVLIIANAITPVLLSKVANQNNNDKNISLSISLSKLSFLLSLTGLIVLLLIPESFFVAVLGNGFMGIKKLITLCSPGVLAVSAFIPLINYFTASGRQFTSLWAYGAGLCVTLLLAPLMVANYGTTGAAITSNLTYIVILIFVCYRIVRENKMPLSGYMSLKNDVGNLKQLFSKKSSGKP